MNIRIPRPVLVGGLPLSLLAIAITLVTPASSAPPSMLVSIGKDVGLFADTAVIKLLDANENVVCYILAPERVSSRLNTLGKSIYEGNNVGSISCVKRDAAPASLSGPGKGAPAAK